MLRFSGLPFFFRECLQKNKVTILVFHDINKETAEKTFSYLIKNYNIIDLDVYREACEKRDFSKVPKKALIITFDDGWMGNYDLLELIEQFNIPITIFLCAGIIGTNRHFWFTEINDNLREHAKHMSNETRLDALKTHGFDQNMNYESPQALTKNQIHDMKKKVNLQSHTIYHPVLPKCNHEVAKKEIFGSKEILEQEYGLEINAISYPNGDYSYRDITLVKEAGYKCAITVDYGFNTRESDLFTLKRLMVNDTSDINELIVKSSGIWAFIKTLNGRRQQFGYANNHEDLA